MIENLLSKFYCAAKHCTGREVCRLVEGAKLKFSYYCVNFSFSSLNQPANLCTIKAKRAIRECSMDW
jgi:hypothetical protein